MRKQIRGGNLLFSRHPSCAHVLTVKGEWRLFHQDNTKSVFLINPSLLCRSKAAACEFETSHMACDLTLATLWTTGEETFVRCMPHAAECSPVPLTGCINLLRMLCKVAVHMLATYELDACLLLQSNHFMTQRKRDCIDCAMMHMVLVHMVWVAFF